MTSAAPRLDLRRRPRQARSRQTVAFVLEAAAQVFGERGYLGTTTNHVAERAGVSIGTLYQYFPNKDALLLALAEQHLAEGAAVLDEVAAQLHEAAPAAPELVRSLVETTVAVNEQAVHLVLVDEAPRTPELQRSLDALHRTVADDLVRHLRRLGLGGDDPRLTALVLVHTVDALVHRVVLRQPGGRTREQCLDEVVTLCMRHLGTAASADTDVGDAAE